MRAMRRPPPRPPGRPGRPPPRLPPRGGDRRDPSYLYVPGFVSEADRAEVAAWLATLRPLWEMRYSTRRAPPVGREQKRLLRPVYWLGNWQFACLGYYSPPRGVRDRCVAAEPFPPPLRRWVTEVEARVRREFPAVDVPRGWRLNTCLVNFYGDRREPAGDRERWVDVARVGEHRDFEPGPVASVSLGERALFQFVARAAGGAPPVRTQWLDDGSLQVFAGPRWKDDLLHRVQRVDRKAKVELPPAIEGFRTRRINFTFRYVPPEHVVPFAALGAEARADVRGYVEELAASARFFRDALNRQ
jgi:alkylated DNA repair dioxygenase AlkB